MDSQSNVELLLYMDLQMTEMKDCYGFIRDFSGSNRLIAKHTAKIPLFRLRYRGCGVYPS